MKVSLIYFDFPADPKAILEGWGFYSEGVASISTVLKKGGHKVSLLHLIKEIPKEKFLENMEKENPNLIGFSFTTDSFHRLPKYLKWIKENKFNIPIICGSYHSTLAPEEVINIKEVDMVCIGEGEYPMLELCDKIEKKENYEYIESLWIKTKNGIIKNRVSPLVENLDTLPFPDFALFDLHNLIASKINTATITISRGCPYNCSYCANHAIRKMYPNSTKYTRNRSPENSIELD
ncbi:MAG: Hopanoid C-3 methylase [candidate division WS2 bacterium]|nr:Hopanoid C-3 methylase [Candidatus Psychracetigena formicireducens]